MAIQKIIAVAARRTTGACRGIATHGGATRTAASGRLLLFPVGRGLSPASSHAPSPPFRFFARRPSSNPPPGLTKGELALYKKLQQVEAKRVALAEAIQQQNAETARKAVAAVQSSKQAASAGRKAVGRTASTTVVVLCAAMIMVDAANKKLKTAAPLEAAAVAMMEASTVALQTKASTATPAATQAATATPPKDH